MRDHINDPLVLIAKDIISKCVLLGYVIDAKFYKNGPSLHFTNLPIILGTCPRPTLLPKLQAKFGIKIYHDLFNFGNTCGKICIL